jgi:CDP-6-deoxy-D-xylo-4-hexulose-3-dehydrase
MSTKIDRRELLIFLNKHKIETRLFFAGNITKQPAYKNVDFAVYEALNNTDNITRQGFWLGIHPGITEKMIDYVIEVLNEFLKGI